VYTHQSFEDSTILESIHRNWPELISGYRAKGVTGGEWTEEQRRTIRRKHANVMTRTKDGTGRCTGRSRFRTGPESKCSFTLPLRSLSSRPVGSR
jgi:hypothetical protein